MIKVSVVINTLNEERNIKRAINSVLWADEIIVCDMYSDDKTVHIAKSLGIKVVYHKRMGYVEPARNFAISKTSGEWVLILDADEEIPRSLVLEIKRLLSKPIVSDFVEIPRKNIIFGSWMMASGWWPDYNIRLFKKGAVSWTNNIHRPPETKGQGIKLDASEKFAIIHNHYQTISQFLIRMDRYTTIQARELIKNGYKFRWGDLLEKPIGEFLSRFFALRGFEDGVHGLALSILQGFSHFVLYLKVWEEEKFAIKEIEWRDLSELKIKLSSEINYWFNQKNLSQNKFKNFFQKIQKKLS